MLAAHVPETGTIRLVDWPDPVATEPGQFVVRLLHSAVCGSDIHAMLEGNMHPSGPTAPGYSGHEGVGVVTATRSGRGMRQTAPAAPASSDCTASVPADAPVRPHIP